MEDIRSLIEESAPTSRLGRWFVKNRAAFEAATDTARPRWEVLAVRFAEERLISVPPEFWDDHDTPARQLARKRAAQAVRQVWYRVKRRPVIQKAVPAPGLIAAPATNPPVRGGGQVFAPATSRRPTDKE